MCHVGDSEDAAAALILSCENKTTELRLVRLFK